MHNAQASAYVVPTISRTQSTSREKFEANFNLHPDSAKGAGGSHDVPPGPSNAVVPYLPEDTAKMENTLIEYTANNVFGDFD